MSVDTRTGEILTTDRAAAERRAERIRLRLDAIADNVTTVLPMIREAIELDDPATLGYRSTSEYVADRFGGALSRLPVDLRRPVVHELAAAGMSVRAIAPVVGVGKSTAARDLESGVPSGTPGGFYGPGEEIKSGEPMSTDNLPNATAGEEVTPTATEAGDAAQSGEPSEAVEAVAPEPPARSVTGIDGKTYTKKPSKPKSPPRRPLPDQFFDAAFDMGKAIEKVARITEDDRFPQNAEKVAAKHRNDLIRSRDLLQQVIDRLA